LNWLFRINCCSL